MSRDFDPHDLTDGLAGLKPKSKEPNSARVLDVWIAQAEQTLGNPEGGRLSWLVATTIVAAKLQQIVDGQDASRFLLKGGTMLQHRLGLVTRATKDLDALVRGDIDDFLAVMDQTLSVPWGPVEFRRNGVEIIEIPSRVVKPRKFDVILMLRGKTWRKIRVEISPDEGEAGSTPELFAAPSLAGFGLPTPDHLVSLAMSYQIAQKVHAASDLHNPPTFINDRVRDVVDLVLLRSLAKEAGEPSPQDILRALKDTFNSRAAESKQLGRPERLWPARIVALNHWEADYGYAAKSVGVDLTLEAAVVLVNSWLDELDQAGGDQVK